MNNFHKNTIQKNFSKAAKVYNESVSVQVIAAQNLCNLAQKFFDFKVGVRILDLGCGTGFIVKNLRKFWPGEIIALDLSWQMLQETAAPNVFPIQADLEKMPFCKNSFDLLISSFSLQWVSDLESFFTNCAAILKRNGNFFFCLPVFGSLLELREASEKSGCNFDFIDLPQIDDLQSKLIQSGFNKVFVEEKFFTQNFASGYEAIKLIKKIGAGYSKKSGTDPVITKSNLVRFDQVFSGSISWKCLFVGVSKID